MWREIIQLWLLSITKNFFSATVYSREKCMGTSTSSWICRRRNGRYGRDVVFCVVKRALSSQLKGW